MCLGYVSLKKLGLDAKNTSLQLKLGFGIACYAYVQILRSIGAHGGQNLKKSFFNKLIYQSAHGVIRPLYGYAEPLKTSIRPCRVLQRAMFLMGFLLRPDRSIGECPGNLWSYRLCQTILKTWSETYFGNNSLAMFLPTPTFWPL